MAHLTALSRFAPVIDQNTQERQKDDAGTDQHIPENTVKGPAKKRSKELQIAIDTVPLARLTALTSMPCPNTSSNNISQVTARQRNSVSCATLL